MSRPRSRIESQGSIALPRSKRQTGQASTVVAPRVVLRKRDLGMLVDLLAAEYDVIAPVAEDAGIIMKKVSSLDEVATGYRDVQSPGEFRLEHDPEGLYFGY